jgi:hypothetical protein
MNATDMLARWESRRGELARLHAQVDGAALVEEFLSDLEAMAADEQPVTLTRAAAVTGYSADHLSRLIKSGKLKDHGRKHAPRVKVSECPRKPAIAAIAGQQYNANTDALSLVGSRR